MNKSAIILLSGGLDSTTCLAYARQQQYTCHALSFYYGQKQQAELKAAANIATVLGAKSHQIIDLTAISSLKNTALVDTETAIADYNTSSNIPNTYVPARNTILLAIALGYAEVQNADSIFIGASSIDYSGYPDCRPEYFQAFNDLANLATKRAVEGEKLQIITPLLQLSKAQTIELGISLGVDYSMTVSCYRANAEGLACGKCDSCHYRQKGFAKANVADPTRYYN